MRLVSYGKPRAWTSGIELGESVVETTKVATLAGWSEENVAAAGSNRTLLELGPDALRQLERIVRDRTVHLKPMPPASL